MIKLSQFLTFSPSFSFCRCAYSVSVPPGEGTGSVKGVPQCLTSLPHQGPTLLHPSDSWKTGASSSQEASPTATLRPHQGSEPWLPQVRWQKPRGVIPGPAWHTLAGQPQGKPCFSLSLVPIQKLPDFKSFQLLGFLSCLFHAPSCPLSSLSCDSATVWLKYLLCAQICVGREG